jgi:hypothetical protein
MGSNTNTSALVASPKSLSELRLFTLPEGGIDRMSFATVDTIEVPGLGEDTIELRGYYAIERGTPTSASWHDATVDIYMRELSLIGVSQKFGRIRASVNNNIGKESKGQVQPGLALERDSIVASKCEMAGYMQFELLDLGFTVFNKEPIYLRHDITHIPPVGMNGGTGGRVAVDLYRADDPEGAPVAILREVKTHIGEWLAELVKLDLTVN